MSLGGARREPLGVIPHWTNPHFHTPDGRLVENMFWYTIPTSPKNAPLFNGMRDRQWTEIEKARGLRPWIAAHQYRQEFRSQF